MGFTSATAGRIWIVLFDDAGTLRLGAINCLTTAAGAGSGRDVTAIYPLRDDLLVSSTAEGGAGAADSAQVFYTGTAVTTKALRILGYMEWSSGLTTAGTWAIVPTKIQLLGPGISLPGQVVQTVRNDTGAVATGTTQVVDDDTIPQITEGDQYMSQAIIPTATPNVLEVCSLVHLTSSLGARMLISCLFQDAVANALKVVSHMEATANYWKEMAVDHRMLSQTASSTTFKIRCGLNFTGTTTFNGQSGNRFFGGTMNSFLQVTEIMA